MQLNVIVYFLSLTLSHSLVLFLSLSLALAGGPGQVGEAGAGRGSSAVQPITISAQTGSFVFSPIMTGNTVAGSVNFPTGNDVQYKIHNHQIISNEIIN